MIINTQSARAKFLVNALKANGVFSLLSGLLMLVMQDTASSWFGQVNPLYFVGVGVGLIGFALRLFYLAGPGTLLPLEVKLIIGSDIGWVVGSLILTAVFFVNIQLIGVLTVLFIGAVVGGFAIAQAKGLTLCQTK